MLPKRSRGECNPITHAFTPDTPVLTRAGLLPIASLTLGQDVLAYNEAKGQNEYQPIQQVFVNQDPQITFLQVDQELVTTIPEHPFRANLFKRLFAKRSRTSSSERAGPRSPVSTVRRLQAGAALAAMFSYVPMFPRITSRLLSQNAPSRVSMPKRAAKVAASARPVEESRSS